MSSTLALFFVSCIHLAFSTYSPLVTVRDAAFLAPFATNNLQQREVRRRSAASAPVSSEAGVVGCGHAAAIVAESLCGEARLGDCCASAAGV
ncbi:hypothetical protein PF008_g14471 [Phytophthora fragariae]|uniref:Secreted protein n=1 Tax=Phytophthora fragariae TaxID=53985 RepID=A0A6G0RGZ1_9STRA|nr:hypothetical protein PF008_g14471 [Phytophthora fragariae]